MTDDQVWARRLDQGHQGLSVVMASRRLGDALGVMIGDDALPGRFQRPNKVGRK